MSRRAGQCCMHGAGHQPAEDWMRWLRAMPLRAPQVCICPMHVPVPRPPSTLACPPLAQPSPSPSPSPFTPPSPGRNPSTTCTACPAGPAATWVEPKRHVHKDAGCVGHCRLGVHARPQRRQRGQPAQLLLRSTAGREEHLHSLRGSRGMSTHQTRRRKRICQRDMTRCRLALCSVTHTVPQCDNSTQNPY